MHPISLEVVPEVFAADEVEAEIAGFLPTSFHSSSLGCFNDEFVRTTEVDLIGEVVVTLDFVADGVTVAAVETLKKSIS